VRPYHCCAAAWSTRRWEDHVGTAARGVCVGGEARKIAVQARIERMRGLSGERVGAQRDHLELGVADRAVERLVAGVAGAAKYRGGEHIAYYAR
jgi:hypothetical protein